MTKPFALCEGGVHNWEYIDPYPEHAISVPIKRCKVCDYEETYKERFMTNDIRKRPTVQAEQTKISSA